MIAGLAAAGFNLATVELSFGAAAQGVVDGVLAAVAIGGYLTFLRDGPLRDRMRRLTFLGNVGIDSAVVLVLFLLTRAVGLVLTSGDPRRFLESFLDPHLIYAIPFVALVVIALNFVIQMNSMVGTNVLRYFLTGVYHQPVEEQRLFLFLDLIGSTRLAEQLGSSTYYNLLRRFVDDLTEPILATRGEIYQYAGDEVVITWRMKDGLRDANCVRCFFAIEDAVAARTKRYQREFGVVPSFRGGLHGGTVIAGELGDLKHEIVFVGDVLNTASRLEEYARAEKRAFVVSAAVLDPLELPEDLVAHFECELQPRGKEQQVEIYRVERVPHRP